MINSITYSSEEGFGFDGGRDIYLANFKAADRNAVLTSSLVLQHEAYRDGVVTPDNASETAMAVIAHTLMAWRKLPKIMAKTCFRVIRL